MAKFPEAHARLNKNAFVCKDCKTKIKAQQMKVLQGNVRCRNCKGSSLRTVRLK